MTVKLLNGPLAIRVPTPGAIVETFRFWLERNEERRRLMDLDERMLRDIGMTRGQATREAAKPFWAD